MRMLVTEQDFVHLSPHALLAASIMRPKTRASIITASARMTGVETRPAPIAHGRRQPWPRGPEPAPRPGAALMAP